LTKSTDAKGFVTTLAYDQLDRQITATSGGPSATKAYNAAGRVIAETLSGKNTTTTYDGMGRVVSMTKPDGSSIAHVYDEFGRAVSEVTATYTYDGAGQRTRSVVTSGSVTTTTEWTYEGLTLLRSVSVTGGQTTTADYVNDETGRPVGAWVRPPGSRTPPTARCSCGS